MASIAGALRRALDLQREGRGGEAEILLRRVIEADPGNTAARRLLAIGLCDRGEGEAALTALEPLTRSPHANGALWMEHVRALLLTGRTGKALRALRHAIALSPDDHRLWEQAARSLGAVGDWAASAGAARNGFRAAPSEIELERMWLHSLGERGRSLLASGRVAEAIPALLGGSHCMATMSALHDAGVAALDRDDHVAAAPIFRALTLIDPANVGALTNIAGCLIRARDHSGAGTVAGRALRIDPATPAALAALADTRFAAGGDDEAIPLYEKALRLAPGLRGARHNLALALLRAGRLAEGWEAYAARWDGPDAAPFVRPFTRGPGAIRQWAGGPMDGGTLFIHAEQGLGDTLQFARFLPRVARCDAGRVIVEVQPPLVRLIGDALAGDDRFAVVPRPPDFPAARFDVPIDAQINMMDLGALFCPTLDDVATDGPYLRADPERADVWRRRVDAEAPGARPRCGLVWNGNPRNPNDRQRSIPAEALAPLFAVPGVAWLSCQLGPAADDRRGFPVPVVDLTDGFHDFTDTAAVLSALDLVITVDTSVAHLAGGLGRPVWIALPHPPDWRWGIRGGTTPWYPSARLFRQRIAGDWSAPVAEMAAALEVTTHGLERE